jgi:site-specific recombinase XerD
MDVISLQRLLGHSNVSVLRRHLLQTAEDLQRAHAERGPVDQLLGGTKQGVGA